MIYTLEIKCKNGIQEGKIKVNIEKIIFYGEDLMLFMVTEVIMFSLREKWMGQTCQMEH